MRSSQLSYRPKQLSALPVPAQSGKLELVELVGIEPATS
jgi:hypothetical protein